MNSAHNNATGLTVGAVDSLASSSVIGGHAQVTATGQITVAAPIAATGSIALAAHDTAASGDDLTVLSGVTLQSTSNFVQLLAGDNLVLQAGSTVQGTVGSFSVDFFNADPGVGGTTSLNGTVAGTQVFIQGAADADILIGTPNADTLNGSNGADVMVGHAGNDSYFVDNGGDVVSESERGQRHGVCEHPLCPASRGREPGVARQRRSAGIRQRSGQHDHRQQWIESFDGRGGADSMTGGAGNDTYFVDDAGDVVVENANEGTDAVFSAAHFALSANVETLVLQGSADLQGYGDGLANALYGNTGSNLLDGRAGADIMYGGPGNDVYVVDDAGDVVVENTSEGTDAVFSTAHFALSANVETLAARQRRSAGLRQRPRECALRQYRQQSARRPRRRRRHARRCRQRRVCRRRRRRRRGRERRRGH
jgi:Ca2+-binding RTX toxin-like protein